MVRMGCDRRSRDELRRAIEALQERLTGLSEASLRINRSLDLQTVLKEVLEGARELTGARCGAIATLDESGCPEDMLTSGLSRRERESMRAFPDGAEVFEYLGAMREPLRVRDLASHLRAQGFGDFRPPLAATSFLGTPMHHRELRTGSFFLAGKEGAAEFGKEDEETLVTFASQAALVIANARRHRDERRARADLEALISTSPVGVAVIDARSGVPVSFNREAARIVGDLQEHGRPPERLLEILTFRRADGRRISLEEFPLAQVLSTGETVLAEEMVLEVPDGRSVRVLLNATPIYSDEGEVESVVVTMQDMTPLEELERLRAEFVGMVSHELRTPLTSIRGSAATLIELLSGRDSAEIVQLVRIIEGQAGRMRDLINDLLDVAHIETGTLSVEAEPADLAVLVDDARNTFLSSGGRENIRIELPPDLPYVMADGRRIVQVLGNLLSNAARHSPASSVITVSAAVEGVHVAVAVTDESRGISADRLPHLFRKFSRIRRDDWVSDTGLGLAICREIVEAHGGRIRAESEGTGLGARFTFTLPVADPGRSSDVASGATEGAHGGRRPADAQVRPRHTLEGRLRSGDDRGSAGRVPTDEGGSASPGAAGPDAARHKRHGADGGDPEYRRRARDLPVGLRAGRDYCGGFRGGSRRLRGQAVLGDRACGQDRCRAAQVDAGPGTTA